MTGRKGGKVLTQCHWNDSGNTAFLWPHPAFLASLLCPCALVVLVELLQLQGSLRTGIQILSLPCTWFSTFPHVSTLQQLHCFSSPFYFHNIFEGDLWNAESLTDFSLAPKCSLVTYIRTHWKENRFKHLTNSIPFSISQLLHCKSLFNHFLKVKRKLMFKVKNKTTHKYSLINFMWVSVPPLLTMFQLWLVVI